MASTSSSARILHLHGVEVEFPFKPYTEQIRYMESVIKSLQTGKNALLESPTGTGKTLCLLCATLAWRRSEIKKKIASRALVTTHEKEPDYPLGWGGCDVIPGAQEEETPPSAPRIIYASRTHSQLAQVVNELKRTAYARDAKISILGSREQMCIHPEVSKLTNNTAMIHSCRNKVSKHLCHYYNNVENVRKAGSFTNEVMDIEELVQLGKKRNACPYYAAREQSKEPDCGIIFTPYNYLLDRKSRRSNNIEISGNIVIFDEAHNLERICEESASFDLTSIDIAKCLHEVGELLNAVNKLKETGIVPDGFEAGESNGLSEFSIEELAHLKLLFVMLEQHLQKVQLSGQSKSFTSKGRYMFEFLARMNVTFQSHETIIEFIDKTVSYLSTLSNSFQTRGTALQKFSEVLKIVFSAAGGENPTLPTTLLNSNVATDMMMEELSKFYRVHIREEEAKPMKVKNTWNSNANTIATTSADGTQRTLSYWCFSPGYAMRDLIASGVRNLILTSGTLSPIDSFTCELQVDFPIQLQNSHVIDDHQVFVATFKKTLSSKRLETTFKTRNDYALAQDVGNMLVRFAETCPGGLLVFFPSYISMEGYIKKWEEMSSDIMRKIDLRKPCTIESKNKNSLKDAMEKFYADVAKPQGASFFAICRGKVSEGLDFANNNGRAVVIIGLPFPPSKDPKVREKMSFLETMKRAGGKKMIDGQTWYRLQALRAVNQAIGRVIRHRHDYGAILLLDYRYANKENTSELPEWIRSRVNEFDDAEKAIRRLKSFFCSIQEKEKARIRSIEGGIKKECDSATTSKALASSKPKTEVIFGGLQKKSQISTQPTSKSNVKITKSKNAKFLSIPKTNDLSDHIPSSSGIFSSLPQTTPRGSCTGCPTKRRRISEDEDFSQNLVSIKNARKKMKPPSLLDALNNDTEEKREEKEEDGDSLDAESVKIERDILIRDKILDDQRRGVQKKRIKIVEKSTKNMAVVDDKAKPVGNMVKTTNESACSSKAFEGHNCQKENRLTGTDLLSTDDEFEWDEKKLIAGSGQLYLTAVKKILSGESYNAFRNLLVTLRVKKDINLVIDTLSKFCLRDEKSKIVFRAFVKLVKDKEHIKQFVEKCEELTGKRPEGF